MCLNWVAGAKLISSGFSENLRLIQPLNFIKLSYWFPCLPDEEGEGLPLRDAVSSPDRGPSTSLNKRGQKIKKLFLTHSHLVSLCSSSQIMIIFKRTISLPQSSSYSNLENKFILSGRNIGVSRQDSSFLYQSVATTSFQVNSTRDGLVLASVFFFLAAELGEGQTLLNRGAGLPCSSLGVGKCEWNPGHTHLSGKTFFMEMGPGFLPCRDSCIFTFMSVKIMMAVCLQTCSGFTAEFIDYWMFKSFFGVKV